MLFRKLVAAVIEAKDQKIGENARHHHRPRTCFCRLEVRCPLPRSLALTHGRQIFLLSPARAGGPRYSMLVNEQADFDLARKLRGGSATIGEVYSFISGLYFRGKMVYAERFRA